MHCEPALSSDENLELALFFTAFTFDFKLCRIRKKFRHLRLLTLCNAKALYFKQYDELEVVD